MNSPPQILAEAFEQWKLGNLQNWIDTCDDAEPGPIYKVMLEFPDSEFYDETLVPCVRELERCLGDLWFCDENEVAEVAEDDDEDYVDEEMAEARRKDSEARA